MYTVGNNHKMEHMTTIEGLGISHKLIRLMRCTLFNSKVKVMVVGDYTLDALNTGIGLHQSDLIFQSWSSDYSEHC